MTAGSQESVPDGDEMAIIHDSFGITFGLWRKGQRTELKRRG